LFGFIDPSIHQNRDDSNHPLIDKQLKSFRMSGVPQAFILTLDILNDGSSGRNISIFE